MHIYSVYDAAFKPYGKVLDGFDTAELLAAMEEIPKPESGTAYRPLSAACPSSSACAGGTIRN